ncbi:hypothetical protein BKA70DRAFT_1302388 [Coprinopsis sp. MPI-PUGE-AT-0042]|nr:hypothetical protein BKA70DRAFT_1302388 [Coprinopsis sp. MPI-PUGE-AT-0042]
MTRPYPSSVNRRTLCSTLLCVPLVGMRFVRGAGWRDVGGGSVDVPPCWNDLIWWLPSLTWPKSCFVKETAGPRDEA